MKRIVVCDSGLGGLNIAGGFFAAPPSAEPCELIYFNAYPEAGRGFNTLPDGEEIYYISNPALGLWALKSQFA